MKKAVGPSTAELAKELHDTVCQTLTGTQLHLSVVTRKVKKSCPECSSDLEELQALVARARDELHAIVKKIS